ncbi:MAG: DUF58 domain-containing protein [Aureliella sp.]
MQNLASKIQRLLTTDFCPGASTYVNWLKEPVGWFCVALLSSVLVGAFLTPIGWSIAGGLAAIILLGLGFPWFATRALTCSLSSDRDAVHEGDEAHVLLNVKNPLPLPVIGLVVKGYFAPKIMQEDTASVEPECGLARVPAFSTAQYRLPIKPEYRGRFPTDTPEITCSFPLGIYTARRPVAKVASVTVRPMLLPITADFEWSGSSIAETGFGTRASDHGEFLGVREFRRGDSLRSIHWAQSARQDEIIVCERGGPQKSPVAVRVSTERCIGSNWDARENLAWRVRVAASLVDFFVARHIPFELLVDDRKALLGQGGSAKASAWDALAEVPLEPWANNPTRDSAKTAFDDSRVKQGISIGIDQADNSTFAARYIVVTSQLGEAHRSQDQGARPTRIDLEQPIDHQLAKLLQEVSLDCAAA